MISGRTASARRDPLDRPALAAVASELHGVYGVPTLAYAVVARGAAPVVGACGPARLGGAAAASVRTRFHLGSAAKVLTADVVRELARGGLLDIDGAIGAYVAGLPTAWRAATLRQLMQHTAGIDDYVTHVPDDLGLANAEVYRRMAAVPLLHAPGAAWSYSNTHYRLLGDAIESRTRLTFAAAMRQRFARRGLVDTRVDDGDADDPMRADPCRVDGRRWIRDELFFSINLASADGGISTTAADASRWLSATLDADVAPGFDDGAGNGPILSGGHRFPYAAGEWLDATPAGERQLWHSGAVPGFMAHWLRLPERGIGVCVLCNGIVPPGTPRHIAEALCEAAAPGSTALSLQPLATGADARLDEARALLCGGDAAFAAGPDVFAAPIALVDPARRHRLRVDHSSGGIPDAFDCVQQRADAGGGSLTRYRLRWGGRIDHATIARDGDGRVWRIARC